MNVGFIEVNIETAPERIKFNNDLKCERKQHGLRHHITGTTHSSMGGTCNKMDIYVSDDSKPFKLWDLGQPIVLLLITCAMTNTIFVGSKRDTINALKIINHEHTVV